MSDQKPTVVALTMPHYGEVKFAAARSFYRPTSEGSQVGVVRNDSIGSVLTKNFNHAWCWAINLRESHGVTHFAMLHADVVAKDGWLDVLLGEMNRLNADVVSAVVPIKSEHGLTSTAVGTVNPYHSRRLTLNECHRLPETFDAWDVERELGFRGPLLVNTGCWLADLRKPWCDDADEQGFLRWAFRFADEMWRNPATGKWAPLNVSEDWLFSRHLSDIGAKVYATRKVDCYHAGSKNYVNGKPWGEWDTDEAFSHVDRLARAGENGDVKRHEEQVAQNQVAIGVRGG